MNTSDDNQAPSTPSAQEARVNLALERAVASQSMEGYHLTPTEIERVRKELQPVKPDAP